MEREDIENMVSAMIGDAIKPVLLSQAELRERIIGIDSNGTSRTPGALQRQDVKLQQLDDGQMHMIEQLTLLTTRQENWSKKGFWNLLRWGIPIIITLLALLLSYAGYRAANNKPLASAPVVRETIPADASN